jgi:patatin-like phospholipase/acyl hydrolase
MRRILTIDGGGIKGMFPASFLANIEDAIESPVADYFDLIVGTSTGGIIALGLGLGFSAHELVEFYKDLGPKVFPQNNWWKQLLHFAQGKYDSSPLRDVLTEKFGDRKLGHSTKRLVIPSVNLDKGEPYIYKTAHCERFAYDYKVSAVDVALSTSAGPTYFRPHRIETGTTFVDGGIFARAC